MDKAAYTSHMRAAAATKAGKFKNEIVPLMGIDKKTGEPKLLDSDEGIRYSSNLEKIQSMHTLTPSGRISAASASQITDGASAILICNERALRKYGLTARARIIGLELAGDCPIAMLSAPIPATQKVLKSTGLDIKDIDV